jgi:hypothetical protein
MNLDELKKINQAASPAGQQGTPPQGRGSAAPAGQQNVPQVAGKPVAPQFAGQRSGPPPRQTAPPAQFNPAPSGGLPSGYLSKGYFDEKGNILPEVVIVWALDIARKLDSAYPSMNVSQLRKFFTEVRHIEGQMAAGKDYDSLKGRILKLIVYAADAKKKGGVPDLFKEYIDRNVEWAVKTEKDFLKGFVPHFESVVAFFPRKQ